MIAFASRGVELRAGGAHVLNLNLGLLSGIGSQWVGAWGGVLLGISCVLVGWFFCLRRFWGL